MSGAIDAFNAAWDAYIATLASGNVTGQVQARENLYQAAQLHAATSRPLGSVTRYYIAVHGDPDASPEAISEASQELDGVRRAAAILAGAWPGTPPIMGEG